MTTVILLDTSGSMAWTVGTRRRIDVLADILKAIPPRSDVRRVSFNSVVTEIDNDLPEPGGGTALADALTFAATTNPDHVIVISDGEPDNAEEAIAAARKLGPCRIETYFCGDEAHHEAIAFLRALAWCSADGLGVAAIADLTQPQRLAEDLRLALTHG